LFGLSNQATFYGKRNPLENNKRPVFGRSFPEKPFVVTNHHGKNKHQLESTIDRGGPTFISGPGGFLLGLSTKTDRSGFQSHLDLSTGISLGGK